MIFMQDGALPYIYGLKELITAVFQDCAADILLMQVLQERLILTHRITRCGDI